MIPVELIIEGIYSYRERTRIDFQPLLDAHLFGIFGSVGSGKSSILDAITFALYGQVERMNKRDSVAANMFNLDADSAYIRFTFDSLVNGHRYQCLATGKRRKSGPVLSRECFILEADVPVPVPEQDVHEAIGLSYDHFTRTVIVPQGKFQEFLQLSDKDRTEMMQHLFHLHRFDLAGPLRQLIGNTKSQEQHLSGQLETLERILTIPLAQLETEHKQILLEQATALQNVQRVAREFEIMTGLARTQNRYKQNQESLHALKPLIEVLSIKLEGLEKQHVDLKRKEADLPRLQQLTHQLRLIMDLLTSRQQFAALEENIRQQKAEALPMQEKVKQLRQELDESSRQIAGLLSKQASSELVQAKTAWSYQWEQTELKRTSLETRGKEGRVTLDRDKQNLHAYWQKHWNPTLFEGPLPEDPSHTIPDDLKKMDAILVEMEEEILHLQLQSGLSPFIEQLVEGEPCPLCGALDHPQPFTSDQSREKVDALTLVKQSKRDALHQLKSLWDTSLQLEKKIIIQDERVKALRQEYQELQTLQTSLTGELDSWNLNLAELQTWLKEQSHIQAQINHAQKAYQQQQESLQQVEIRVQQQDGTLKAQEADALRLQSRIDTLSEQIGAMDGYETYLERTREELQANILELEEGCQSIVKEVGASQIQLDDARDLMKQHHIRKEYFEEQDKRLRLELDVQVKSLVDGHPDRYSIDKDIDTDQSLLQLKEELDGLELIASRWSNQRAVLETQIKETTLRMEEAKKLKTEYQVISNKLNNLKTLDTLFRGKGMVDFAASRYLRQILEHANQRFYKMTRHKLRLELGDDNRIMVRDYYHGGALRLVKTLSGGQLFQAALALALSLAEQIRDYRQGDRDFFFLDEGFGTQDRDSLILVLDTLKALREENRSVGIISHVEDLQQEVNAYLKINLDPTRGSLITTSHS